MEEPPDRLSISRAGAQTLDWWTVQCNRDISLLYFICRPAYPANAIDETRTTVSQPIKQPTFAALSYRSSMILL